VPRIAYALPNALELTMAVYMGTSERRARLTSENSSSRSRRPSTDVLLQGSRGDCAGDPMVRSRCIGTGAPQQWERDLLRQRWAKWLRELLVGLSCEGRLDDFSQSLHCAGSEDMRGCSSSIHECRKNIDSGFLLSRS